MHNLTTAQYGILRTSAHNFCVTANDKDPSEHLYNMSILADEVAILLGALPSKEACHKASNKAKEFTSRSFEECMENADKILALFIGDFTVEAE